MLLSSGTFGLILSPLKIKFLKELKISSFYLRIGSGFHLGPVVRKPINVNPRLKVNQGFHHTS